MEVETLFFQEILGGATQSRSLRATNLNTENYLGAVPLPLKRLSLLAVWRVYLFLVVVFRNEGTDHAQPNSG